MEVTGSIKMIGETTSVGAGGFRKRDVVVTTNEQYPQHILVQFVQDKCELLNNFKIGQNVKIDINLRGRIWTNPQGQDQYFNTIQGWRIFEENAAPYNPQPQGSAADAYLNKPKEVLNNNDEEDDLPF